MSNQVNNNEKGIEDNDHRGGQESHVQNEDEADDHDHDMVMPGFRFHPTEEELIEFYLRRKVEGKRFNVELITFLDLYRYDPWELPGKTHLGVCDPTTIAICPLLGPGRPSQHCRYVCGRQGRARAFCSPVHQDRAMGD